MIISTKVGGQGFKMYTLCWNNYILEAYFTSKIAKIDGLKKHRGLLDTLAVCLQLMKCYLQINITAILIIFSLKQSFSDC